MKAFPVKIKSFTIGVAAFLCSAIFLSGCNNINGDDSGDTRVLAVINNYALTVDDFKNEADITHASMYLSQSGEEEKKVLLDDVMTKKVLLQEAHKQNFDKDKAFMKEIERYWEQALLKLLIEEKTEELASSINVTEEEVRDEYNTLLAENSGDFGSYEKQYPAVKRYVLQKKVHKKLNDWVDDLRNKSNVEVNEELLSEIKLSAKAEE